MAGVSAESSTFFSVSPKALARPECFAVRRGDTTGRVDPRHHALREALNSPYPLAQLGALVRAEPGYGLSTRAATRVSGDEPRYIRITDFGEDGVEPGHTFVTAEEVESGYDLEVGDILFARTGSVGRTYIHEDTSEPAIFAGYCIRFQFDADRALPRFVYWWTKTAAYNRWVEAIRRPSVQSNINKEEFKSCLIPLPPLELQEELVAAMDAARGERREKLAAADGLLEGLNDLVLGELGIEQPAVDGRRVYAVRLGDTAQQDQLNADYYHPERIAAVRALIGMSGTLPSATLSEVADFKRQLLKTSGENYLGLAQIQSHTGELNNATDKASGNCYAYQEDDVLFARLRPYLNKVYRAEVSGSCSTEFHVLRVKDRETLSPEYLAAVLRSRLVLAQTVHMMAGNTHPRLTDQDVANLRVPVPDIKTQETIANKIIRRRDEARRLRSESEAGWQKAKSWFEVELLGAYV